MAHCTVHRGRAIHLEFHFKEISETHQAHAGYLAKGLKLETISSTLVGLSKLPLEQGPISLTMIRRAMHLNGRTSNTPVP